MLLRNLFAFVSGLFATMIVVTFVSMANARLVYPAPAGIDLNDVAAANAFIAGMPLAALLLLVLAWVGGAFAGGFVTARLAGSLRRPLAVLVGMLVAAGDLHSAMTVVHPPWVAVSGVALPPLAAWLGAWLAQRPAADQKGLASTR